MKIKTPEFPARSSGVLYYAQSRERNIAAEAARGSRRRIGSIKEEFMRLDKYLKVSRLIKRRTVANEACDAGRVLVNGKPAKASAAVKEGDQIEIQFGSKAVKVEVLSVQETVRKEAAAEMYRYL